MAAQGYVLRTGAFALSSTPKTAINLIAGASISATITQLSASVAASTGRFLVELFESTQAGNGTGATATGAKQTYGFLGIDTVGPGCTYGLVYTTEPTVLTILEEWWLPCPGPLILQYPLGRENTTLVSGATKYKAIGFRLSVDSGTPNGYGSMRFEE
jgi:hypothetical protein